MLSLEFLTEQCQDCINTDYVAEIYNSGGRVPSKYFEPKHITSMHTYAKAVIAVCSGSLILSNI